MKTTLLMTAAVVLATANFASAASLQNKDNVSYDIRVTGSSTMSASIDAGVIKNNICTDACTIEVKGVGSIDAEGSDKIVIENGALTKQ